MEHFFDIFEKIVNEHQIRPENIWNWNETMITVNDRRDKVVQFGNDAIKFEKRPGNIEHTTLLFCVSAAGV